MLEQHEFTGSSCLIIRLLRERFGKVVVATPTFRQTRAVYHLDRQEAYDLFRSKREACRVADLLDRGEETKS